MPRPLTTLILLTALAATLLTMNPNYAAPAPKDKERLLRHVVLFKFKPDATKDQIKAIEEAFKALPGKIDAIHDFEWGTDNSPEKLSKGFTHCFLVTFKHEKARETYLPHAEHQAFVERIKPILEDVLVVDYWTGG
jgi:hypothetical protein